MFYIVKKYNSTYIIVINRVIYFSLTVVIIMSFVYKLVSQIDNIEKLISAQYTTLGVKINQIPTFDILLLFGIISCISFIIDWLCTYNLVNSIYRDIQSNIFYLQEIKHFQYHVDKLINVHIYKIIGHFFNICHMVFEVPIAILAINILLKLQIGVYFMIISAIKLFYSLNNIDASLFFNDSDIKDIYELNNCYGTEFPFLTHENKTLFNFLHVNPENKSIAIRNLEYMRLLYNILIAKRQEKIHININKINIHDYTHKHIYLFKNNAVPVTSYKIENITWKYGIHNITQQYNKDLLRCLSGCDIGENMLINNEIPCDMYDFSEDILYFNKNFNMFFNGTVVENIYNITQLPIDKIKSICYEMGINPDEQINTTIAFTKERKNTYLALLINVCIQLLKHSVVILDGCGDAVTKLNKNYLQNKIVFI